MALVGGDCVPIVVVAALVAAWGTLGALVDDVIVYNFGYIGAGGSLVPGWNSVARLHLLMALEGGAFLWLVTRWLRGRRELAPVWLLCTSLAALLGGRFYVHYAIQVFPALCVVCAPRLVRWFGGHRAWKSVLALGCGVIAGVTLLVSGLNAGGVHAAWIDFLPYYRASTAYNLGLSSWQEFADFLDVRVARTYAVSDALRAQTNTDFEILFEVREAESLRDPMPVAHSTPSATSDSKSGPIDTKGPDKDSPAPDLLAKYTFDAYVVGPSHQLAHASSRAVAEIPANLAAYGLAGDDQGGHQHDRDRLGVDAAGPGHRADLDAFAAARAGVGHRGGTLGQRGFERDGHAASIGGHQIG